MLRLVVRDDNEGEILGLIQLVCEICDVERVLVHGTLYLLVSAMKETA